MAIVSNLKMMCIQKIPAFFLLLLAATVPLFAFGKCIGDQSAKTSYSVYIVPQLTVTQTYSHWAPLLEHLGSKTQQCFELIIPQTIPLFEKALLSGKPDFVFMNPYHAVLAFRAHQYIPLIADGKNKLDGIIVVRADSNFSELKSLNNLTIAFPAPNAFAASLLLRATLAKEGVVIKPIYVNTHQNVYRSVIMGDASAGGGVNNTLDRELAEIKAQLKILYKTPSFMPHPFAVNPRVPLNNQRAVRDAFIAMKNDPALIKILNDVQIPDPIVVNYKKDYAPLEKLNLEKFVVISEN